MIRNFNSLRQLENPTMYLCNPDQTELFVVMGENRHVILRFNDLSTLSFSVTKNSATEDYFDLLESKRLIKVEDIGWFQITKVDETSSGDSSTKNITAESHQCILRTKGFYTEERVYMFYNPNDPLDKMYNAENVGAMPSVIGQLNSQLGIGVELIRDSDDEVAEHKNWTITYIDDSLKFEAKSYGEMYTPKDGSKNECRHFTSNTTYGYDFIINDVEKAFQVVFDFDILTHTIAVKKIEDITTETDVYLSFDNLVNTISLSEDAENIITVMSCNGSNLDIRTVNPTGQNYIVNFDYYKGVCKQDLIDKIILKATKSSNEEIREFAELLQEDFDNYKAKTYDFSQTVFGNIDTNNRKIINWTQKKIDENIDAINSFSLSIEIGSYSTVLGMCETFGIDEKMVDIAFSPILQNKESPRLLSKFVVNDYILDLLEESLNDNSETPLKEKILNLDKVGKCKDGIFVKGLIADVGDTAIITSEIMHYTGINGSLNNDFNILLEDLINEDQCQLEICAYNEFLENESNSNNYKWMSKNLTDALYNWEIECKKWNKHLNERTNHSESFSELVSELQTEEKSKFTLDEKLTYAKAKLIDLQNASSQYNAKTQDEKDETIEESTMEEPKGYIIVENVKAGENRIKTGEEDVNYLDFDTEKDCYFYYSAPIPIKHTGEKEKITYKFSFNGNENPAAVGVKNARQALLTLTNGDSKNQFSNVPFYFIDGIDGNTKTFCKLKPKAEIEVADKEGVVVFDKGTTKEKRFAITYNNTAGTGHFNIALNGANIEPTSGNPAYFTHDGVRYSIKIDTNETIAVSRYVVDSYDRYTTLQDLPKWCELWTNEISSLTKEIEAIKENNIKPIEEKLKYISDICYIKNYILNQEDGEALYNELQNYWIEGDYNNDTLAVLENTSIDETIDLAKELKTAGEKELAKVCQPTFQMSIDVVNFLDLLEYKEFAKQLELGKVVSIEKIDGLIYKPALISIDFDLDNSTNFVLGFSNANKPDEAAMTFADLLKESNSTNRSVSANWSNLTKYSRESKKIDSIINDPLNRSLRALKDNAFNQEFIVDNTGVLGRKYDDDSKTSFSKKQLRIVNNSILFTEDNWESSSLAMGEVSYYDATEGEVNTYGIIADAIVGDLLLGKQLRISNNNNTIQLDESGITIKKKEIDQNGDDGTINGDLVLSDVFKVDTNGNVKLSGNIALDGDITLGGDIKWSTESSPMKALYSSQELCPNSPTEYKNSDVWKITQNNDNRYVSYSYDGGETWTDPIRINAKDGDPGAPGAPGDKGDQGDEGIGISSVIEYFISTKKSTVPAINTNSTPPTINDGDNSSVVLKTQSEIGELSNDEDKKRYIACQDYPYLWRIKKTVYTDESVTYEDCATLVSVFSETVILNELIAKAEDKGCSKYGFFKGENGDLFINATHIQGGSLKAGSQSGIFLNETLSDEEHGLYEIEEKGIIRFWAGNTTPKSANFYVTDTGYVKAENAFIKGEIEVDKGVIGKVKIDNGGLYSPNKYSLSDNIVLHDGEINIGNSVYIKKNADGVPTIEICNGSQNLFEMGVLNNSGKKCGLVFVGKQNTSPNDIKIKTTAQIKDNASSTGINITIKLTASLFDSNGISITHNKTIEKNVCCKFWLVRRFDGLFNGDWDEEDFDYYLPVEINESVTISKETTQAEKSITLQMKDVIGGGSRNPYASATAYNKDGDTSTWRQSQNDDHLYRICVKEWESYSDYETKYKTTSGFCDLILKYSEDDSYSEECVAEKIMHLSDGSHTSLQSYGNFLPYCPNNTTQSEINLGDDNHVWNTVRAQNINTSSDIKEKKDITSLNDNYSVFFDSLKPCSYKFKNGESGRNHTGFIAQEVEEALSVANIPTSDFAGLCISNDGNNAYSLRYDEFIPLNTYEIQKLKKRVQQLEEELAELKQ